MIEFTPREIRAIGERRWLYRNKRVQKAIGVLVLALAVDLALSIILKGRLNSALVGVIMIMVAIPAVWYYMKVFTVDSTKAGKKFLEEYQKERQS